jgi:hypothetical protein
VPLGLPRGAAASLHPARPCPHPAAQHPHVARCTTLSPSLSLSLLALLPTSHVVQESDNAELFSEVDQKQLLYRLLSHVVLGGPMCQYEEELTPYVETVKRLYR